ncbi:MAG TPA: ATP-binding cassette domain-containing protein, partial [Halioglobus sp.]
MLALDKFRKAFNPARIWQPKAPERQILVGEHKSFILYVEDVTVSFDGFKALNSLNLYIDRGELRCIIGANGAGKSTMMDVITGKLRPDHGIVYFGENIDLLKLSEPE